MKEEMESEKGEGSMGMSRTLLSVCSVGAMGAGESISEKVRRKAVMMETAVSAAQVRRMFCLNGAPLSFFIMYFCRLYLQTGESPFLAE